MGEDAEGAAENVSKLRQQMLALTGVDIQLDDTTYKSTYQILLEISKVWGKLDDLSRSSVLEQLFGKRQANIGAAILENGDLLEKVYKSAEGSMGSAMREQEEYAKSIQYSLDTLKAAYQDFSQTVIESDFVKNLLGTAQSFLEVLTKIIDKFGVLPTLLTSIATVGSYKGVGIFGTITNESNNAIKSISFLGKSLKDIKADYQSISDDKIGFRKVKAGFSGIFNGGLSDQDILDLREYNKLVESGTASTLELEEAMGIMSKKARSMAESANGAKVNINALTTSEKAATIATEILGAALNTAITLGIGLAIQGIITGIDNLVHAEEKANEAAKELRENSTTVAENYKAEKESLDSLISEYVSLYSTTANLSSEKEKLLAIQKQINSEIKDEKDYVDLLNGSLEENLKLTREQAYHEAKTASNELLPEYNIAKGRQDTYNKSFERLSDSGLGKKIAKEIDESFLDYFDATTDYIEVESRNPVTGETKKELRSILDRRGEILGLNATGSKDSYEDYLDNLDLIIEKYKKWGGASSETYTDLTTLRNEVAQILKDDRAVIEQFDSLTKTQNDYEKLSTDEAKNLDSVLETAASKILELQDATGVTQFRLVQEINELKLQAESLAGDNSVLADSVNAVFSNYKSGLYSSIKGVDDFHEAWFKALNDTEKNTLKNVDTMKSALQSVMNGETISSDTFWQLAELDTDHILNGVKMVGDEFQLTEEQIISLKDTYIKKQMESIQLRQTELEQLKKSEEIEIRQVQALLDKYSAMSLDAHNPNSAANRKAYDDLQNRLSVAKENVKQYGEQWSLNAILLRQYNASLGNTADLIQAAQSQAEKLSEAFVGRIDKVIDGINDQKDALTEEKEVLQDQLDVLEAQADEIKGIIEDYEKVADVVKNTIQDEISAIEESYNKQIEALKAQNEEREEAINLTEKLNNLNNAKNNKVVTYTEAGGFQYGVNKEAVNKAQQEYDKALIDSQIAKLEKERDSATAGFEEYAKLWENATKKATKAEEEELAARILGADWREKISEQDVEIFETYEQKYDEYGVSLNNITNIEIANVKKSIEAKDKEIKAKEDLLKEWQKYKTNVQNYVNDLKNTNKEYEDSIENITLTESSNLDERLANFKTFKAEYESMINRILELQDGVGDIEVNASVKMDDFTDGIKEVVEGIGTVSEKLAEAIKELGKMPSINSAGDVKHYQATGYQHYASGGVNSSTGLAWLDGTRSKPEVVLNNQDATKLYNLLHSMPASAAQMFSSPLTRFAGLRSGNTSQSSAITITGTTINLPNVRDPQQFAREMERYLQTTLTESQIMPPRS